MDSALKASSLPADTDYVLAKLHWMREEQIWPNGLRYLWTDAFGLVLLVSRHPDRVARLNAFFDAYRSGDDYDREAITHVMACTSHFPGEFFRRNWARG
jgi:hypothetical protein